MSAESVATAGQVLDHFGAGDYDGAGRFLDQQVVWYGTRGGLDEEQVLRGPEACVNYMREIADTWQRLDFEIERMIDGSEAVVVFLRETAQPHRSEVEVRQATAIIFKVARGKVFEIRGYLDRGEALRAAGAR